MWNNGAFSNEYILWRVHARLGYSLLKFLHCLESRRAGELHAEISRELLRFLVGYVHRVNMNALSISSGVISKTSCWISFLLAFSAEITAERFAKLLEFLWQQLSIHSSPRYHLRIQLYDLLWDLIVLNLSNGTEPDRNGCIFQKSLYREISIISASPWLCWF